MWWSIWNLARIAASQVLGAANTLRIRSNIHWPSLILVQLTNSFRAVVMFGGTRLVAIGAAFVFEDFFC